ncbi:MAG: LamG-like jellyroll fold domain-containing protein [Candidatus Micrarchaeaceae archaeon]
MTKIKKVLAYGSAILIIIVVLGALYSLGVFNFVNFAPKAPPGACQVLRPNGPGTTSSIKLKGICNGELPEYVASFNGQARTSYVLIPPIEALNEHSSYSISAWLEYRDGSQYFSQNPFPVSWPGCPMGFVFRAPSTIMFFDWYTSNATNPPGCPTSAEDLVAPSGVTIMPDKFYLVTSTYNSSTGQINFYVNGQYISDATVPSGNYLSNYAETGYLGDAMDGNTWAKFFNGSLANIQIYNTSLSPNGIKALYLEGIGGAPIDLQNLAGWWPLNGNANDYSGNGNNGTPINVTYTSSWYSGYSKP